MKIKAFLFVTSVFFCSLIYAQENIIELPLKTIDGLGPFGISMSGISPYRDDANNPWKSTFLKVSGLPANLTDLKLGDIETNMYQSVYQDYLSGKLTKEFYESLQGSWNWKPDTLNLSKISVKCKIPFAVGKDAAGKTQMVVDVNNNLDLSDDPIFTPYEMTGDDDVNWDSLMLIRPLIVSYERLSDNKIITAKTPVLIVYMKKFNMYMCCFPQYATAQLNSTEIAVCSDNFSSLSYSRSCLIVVDDSTRNKKKVSRDKIISTGEYISINGQIYLNKGVIANKNVLRLEKINQSQDQLYSTQVGFKPFAFDGQVVNTNTMVSLEKLKGKYVYLDFWAVWCGPCREEIPNLKALYEKVDKSKFEIIGIVGDSPSDQLEKTITENSITWPQIISDDKNKIKEQYSVSGYPTTLLINPEGIIIAKNLRGKELENKINELIK